MFSSAFAQAKKTIENASQLPSLTHQYAFNLQKDLQGDWKNIYQDSYAAVIRSLAQQIIDTHKKDLNEYEFTDPSSLKSYWGRMGISYLIVKDPQSYLDLIDQRLQIESNTLVKQTLALYYRAFALYQLGTHQSFKSALEALLDQANPQVVSETITEYAAVAENFSFSITQDGVLSRLNVMELNQDVSTVGLSVVMNLISLYAYKEIYSTHVEDYAKILRSYVLKHQDSQTQSIYESISIEGLPGHPVLIGIMDSGVAPGILDIPLWKNSLEEENGIDDDENGFVDDLYGPAFDLDNRKSSSILFPIEQLLEPIDITLFELEKYYLGYHQNLHGEGSEYVEFFLESKEAYHQKFQNTQPSFSELLKAYENYSHGTHVAGIAVAGNPFAKVLPGRITFSYASKGPKPTIASALREAKMYKDIVEYMKHEGVKVVNMSFGDSLQGIIDRLELHGISNVAYRKKLGRVIFSILKRGFSQAISSAPSILFFAAAGNAANNNEFDEIIPSSLILDNLVTVSATDAQGQITSFSSTGKVDLFANGYSVESFLPGGESVMLSGTSMACPWAVNLAAKIWALYPELEVSQVKELILKYANVVDQDQKQIRTLDMMASLEAAKNISLNH